MAAALRLANANSNLIALDRFDISIFEKRKFLGGRAASFFDKEAGLFVDHCQHVGMQCCTFFRDFCEQLKISKEFQSLQTLNFFLPNGKKVDFAAAKWLPAPFHLAPSFLAMSNFSLRQRISIANTVLRLAKIDISIDQTAYDWLIENGQEESVIHDFWETFLVSALGERIERVSLRAAKKVFVDGFLRNRNAYHVLIPQKPLRDLLDENACQRLVEAGVNVFRDTDYKSISQTNDKGFQLLRPQHTPGPIGFDDQVSDARFSDCICTLPWFQTSSFLDEELKHKIALETAMTSNPPSPISGIHLWFDRSITELSHATFIGKTSHWLFNGSLFSKSTPKSTAESREFYYQVVISSDMGSELKRDDLTQVILGELKETFPEAKNAKLLRHKFIEEKKAVFSYASNLDQSRPQQRTAVKHFYLAGDWTRTDWPSTMESAVRSGYFAADELLSDYGIQKTRLPSELPTGWLARFFVD